MGNASLSGARRPYKRDESEGPLSVQLSEKDVSAALRLLKAIVGDEGDLVRAMSDDRDEKVGVLVGQPTKPQNWVPLPDRFFWDAAGEANISRLR